MAGDPRILACCRAAEELKGGRFALDLVPEGDDEVASLGRALVDLGRTLEGSFEKIRTLSRVTEEINSGLILDDVLERVFQRFRLLVPYDRIGLALLEEGGRTVRARWGRSTTPSEPFPPSFSLPLARTSLGQVLESREPRILNDLEAYLGRRPQSASTALLVAAGFRSSLTCPLVAMDKPIGFLFFTSCQRDTYRDVHVELYLQIAGQMATIVEKARLYEELAELSRLKDRFLGIAAHDLRSPLAFIAGYLELLHDGYMGDLTPPQTEAVEKMQRAGRRMLALLNDLLSLNALETGRIRLASEAEDPALLLREVAAVGALLAERKGLRLAVSLEPALPDLWCDRDRLIQALNNLVSNAIKFSHPGTEVVLRAACENGDLLVEVQDHGVGIPEEDLPRLFSFVDRPSVQPTGGELSTGLGLPVVRRIVEAHGGTVAVKSTVGAGSTFTLRLPLRGVPGAVVFG